MHFDVCSKRQETDSNEACFITGRQEKIRKTDGKVLSESRTLSESFDQETGCCSQGGEYRQTCSIAQGLYYEVWRFQLTGCSQNSNVRFFISEITTEVLNIM